MATPLYWCCADLLVLGVKIPQLPSLPPPLELQQRVITELDAMIGRGRASSISDVELAEARYALVAFIDEQILKSNWPGRSEWMGQPLQLVLFGEYAAGENFFNRMRALLQQPVTSPALEVYHLCLMLGFRGAYGVSADPRGLASFSDAAHQRLTQTYPAGPRLAPHAEPPERLPARRASNAPVIAVVAGSLLMAALVVVGLERLLNTSVEEAIDAMGLNVMQTER